MKKFQVWCHKYHWELIVVGVAAALRLYQLGSVPHGMTWDEAAIAYNGFAVTHTFRDEWLHRLPISFMSFGDFKAPLAIYISGVFTRVLGLELWAVRLPFALAGIAAVAGLMWYVHELDLAKTWSTKAKHQLALLAGVILAFSPWHLHFSRAGFESGMSLTFLIYSQLGWLLWQKTKKWWWLAGYVMLGAAAMYTYHSTKIVVPLLALANLWQVRESIKKQFSALATAGVGGLVLLAPMIYDMRWGEGAERLSQTSIFSQDLSMVELVGRVATNFLAHFSPGFLILGETTTLRHGTGDWGVLYPPTLLLLVACLSFAVARYSSLYLTTKRLFWFGLSWWLIGVLPAAIGMEVPHSNRSLVALPGMILVLISVTPEFISWLMKHPLANKWQGSHGETQLLVKTFIGSWVLVQALLVAGFVQHYFTTFARASAADFQDGYLETMEIVKEYEYGLNGKPKVDLILFTSDYGQPYIYALLSRQTSPYMYHGGSLIKYMFTDEVNAGIYTRQNTLAVASGEDEDLPVEKADHVIYGSDGSVRFKLYYVK